MDRIGVEICGGTTARLGRPRVIKLRNVSREYVAQVRGQIGVQALIVIRFEADQPSLQGDARQAARDWFARRRDDMLAMKALAGPNIAFETAINECPNELIDWYVQFSLELIPLMHNSGLRVVAGNPSVGQWDVPVWPKFKPVLNILKPDDFLGLHEYWVDTADIANRWHCGRWAIPEIAAVIGNTKIVITECGRDVVEGRGKPGWRQTCDAATYLEDLRRYDALLQQYPQVVGATVFTLDKNWPNFDVYDIWPQVVATYSNPQTYPDVTSSQPANGAKGPDPNVPYWHSDRHGYAPAWLIMHDTEGPASAALAWWKSTQNAGKSSAHWLIKSNGEVVPVVPEQYAAHHAGGGKWPGIPAGAVDGTSIINLVSIGIEMEYPAAPAAPAWPEAQVTAAVKLAAGIAKRYGIPREHILRHLDVDPANRSDPRNLDWVMFLARVAEEVGRMNEETIRRAAWQALGIPYNPDAAFPRYAREHDLGNPVTREVDVAGYRLQGYAGGIVYARIGDWDNIREIPW